MRSIAVALASGSAWFGMELGKALWRPHDPFYPYTLIFWGLISAFFARATFAYLWQLRYSVPPALADEKEKEARSLLLFIFGTAFAGFCLTMSIIPAKRFGTLCAFGAAILGALTTLMVIITERKIKQVAQSFYPPANGSPI
jgi:hypothetical protein